MSMEPQAFQQEWSLRRVSQKTSLLFLESAVLFEALMVS